MIKDWRGNEIKVGSKIVWPGRSGSRMWLTEGEVVGIGSRKVRNWISGQDEDVPTLKVKETSNSTMYGSTSTKVRSIKVLQRVTVIPESISVTISAEPKFVDPFELPQFPGYQKDPMDDALDAIAKLNSEQRRKITREMVKRSIDLDLNKVKDS
jgi:hypothetical protein